MCGLPSKQLNDRKIVYSTSSRTVVAYTTLEAIKENKWLRKMCSIFFLMIFSQLLELEAFIFVSSF